VSKSKKKILLFLIILFIVLLIPGRIVVTAFIKYSALKPDITKRLSQLQTFFRNEDKQTPFFDEKVFLLPAYFSSVKKDVPPSKILDKHGRTIGIFRKKGTGFIRNERNLPAAFTSLLINTEDKRFYSHKGYHLPSIFRAFIVNLKKGRRAQGGSTLTQQLAKILFTTREKKYSRKIFEVLCTRDIEQTFTKKEILLLYANLIYYGHGATGIENVSSLYFKKKPAQLSFLETAHIVGIIAGPTFYSPYVNKEYSKKRHWAILLSASKSGIIPKTYIENEYIRYWKHFDDSMSLAVSFWPMSKNLTPYYIETIRTMVLQRFETNITEGGCTIKTGLDLLYQNAVNETLRSYLSKYNKNRSNLAGRKLEGSVILLDNKTGLVLAAAGGASFTAANQLLRTHRISRQIGSLIKPFIYIKAFEREDMLPDTILSDLPIKSKWWNPKNYDKKYLTNVTAEFALMTSRNVPTIHLLNQIGLLDFRKYFLALSDLPAAAVPKNMSIGLGTFGMNALSVSRIYSYIARDGNEIKPVFVQRITDKTNAVLFERQNLISSNIAITESLSNVISVKKILNKVVIQPGGTAYKAFTTSGISIDTIFGKTGTTQDARDVWFAGFTPGITCIVWIGYDDNSPIKKASGGKLAAPVWMEIIKKIHILGNLKV
jgi:penicillin-binding protein 1A